MMNEYIVGYNLDIDGQLVIEAHDEEFAKIVAQDILSKEIGKVKGSILSAMKIRNVEKCERDEFNRLIVVHGTPNNLL